MIKWFSDPPQRYKINQLFGSPDPMIKRDQRIKPTDVHVRNLAEIVNSEERLKKRLLKKIPSSLWLLIYTAAISDNCHVFDFLRESLSGNVQTSLDRSQRSIKLVAHFEQALTVNVERDQS